MKTNDLAICLEFGKSSEFIDFEEPTDFVYEYKGGIVGYGDDDRRIALGRFKVFYVNVASGIDAGLDLFEILDANASTDLFTEFFEDNEFLEALQKQCDYDLLSLNMLIIERIEILPRFRGQGLGAKVMKYLVQRYGQGASLVALKAFPLQFEEHLSFEEASSPWRKKMLLDKFSGSKAEATKSLRAYYKKLGFLALPKSELMFANLGRPFPNQA